MTERAERLCFGEDETALFRFDFLGNFSRLFTLKVEALLRKNGLL